MQNPRPAGIKKIFFIFFTVLFSLVVLELALRLSGYAYLRLRYPSEPIKRQAGEFTVLCLGDSFTQGLGAPHGSSYPEQLAQLLNTDRNNKRRFKVYKEFYVNSSTLLKYLNRNIEKYRPDLIIIMTGCNDSWNLENCAYCNMDNGSAISGFNIWLSELNIYKLFKISFLNIGGLLNKNDPSYQLDQSAKHEVKFSCKDPQAQKHLDAGNDYFAQGDYSSALVEFKKAEEIEPDNSAVHFRLTCIYAQVLGDTDLGKKHALLMLTHGNTSMIGYVFVLMLDLYRFPDPSKIGPLINEMKHIIKINYRGNEKTGAFKHLEILSSFYADKAGIEKIIGYNINEIINIVKQRNINLVLMQYPGLMPHARGIIARKADLFKVPLVDNYAIFEDKLKNSPNIRREDLTAQDGHCNAAGYKIIAENVYNTLIQHGMIHDAR